ncbi:hypothetical protein AB1N83_011279 [Pleurotus pulmonarius]
MWRGGDGVECQASRLLHSEVFIVAAANPWHTILENTTRLSISTVLVDAEILSIIRHIYLLLSPRAFYEFY